MKKSILQSIFFVGALILALPSLSAPHQYSQRIEQWTQEGIEYAERNIYGEFKNSVGTLRLESWNDNDDTSNWVFRSADGQFVTGYKGSLEKFKIKKGERERIRLVIREAKTKRFVTWIPMDEHLTVGWEMWSKGPRYVIRWNGKFVNWSKPQLETWANYEQPVLVVRDTADGKNNGKIMTWIPATKKGNTYVYKNESGVILYKLK